jgi:hypothetical protein
MPDSPKQRSFYERALSVITTILPREKTPDPPGTGLNGEKPEVINFRRNPVHKMPCNRPTAVGLPSPEIYPL